MNIETKINCIEDFFKWLDENSYVELTEHIPDDYCEGNDYYHVVDRGNIVNQYKNYLGEVGG